MESTWNLAHDYLNLFECLTVYSVTKTISYEEAIKYALLLWILPNFKSC